MERHNDLPLVRKDPTNGRKYLLDYMEAMDTLQRRHCLCWVRVGGWDCCSRVVGGKQKVNGNKVMYVQVKSKYGEEGMRVFKVLGDANEVQMEQRTVAEKALIVEKVCGCGALMLCT